MIVGGVGESCKVSEGGVKCKDRSTEDDVNQVISLFTVFNPHFIIFNCNSEV